MANGKIKQKTLKLEKEEKKEGVFDFTISALKEGWGLFRENWKKMYVYFLNIWLISVILMLIGIIVGAGIYYFTGDVLLTVGIASVLLILLTFLTGPLNSVEYNIVHNVANAQETDIFAQAKENFVSWLKFSLFWLGYFLIGFSPFILLFGAFVVGLIAIPTFSDGSSNSGMGIAFFGMLMGMIWITIGWIILFLVITLIVQFVIQFAAFEIYIEKNGVRESLKKSYAILTKNFFETLVFDIVVSIALGIIGFFVNLPFQIAYRAGMGMLSFLMSDTTLLVIAGIIVLIVLIVTTLINLLISVAAFSFKYKFWRKARER